MSAADISSVMPASAMMNPAALFAPCSKASTGDQHLPHQPQLLRPVNLAELWCILLTARLYY
jgi:hypothetical protein